jgi:homoserine dehydrogenase
MDAVLANKRPLVEHATEEASLLALAQRFARRVRYEATVGAGLPVISTCDALVQTGDRVRRVEGCLSGTLGFLLTEMEAGRPFSETLRDALARGYTEPDPRDDLSGTDVARKAIILARALGFQHTLSDEQVESLVPPSFRALTRRDFLRRLDELDAAWAARIAAARASGGALRYVATVTPRTVKVGLRVVPASHPFAALRGTDNQVVFHTARYRERPLVVGGPGAGADVTASGVLADLLALVPQ